MKIIFNERDFEVHNPEPSQPLHVGGLIDMLLDIAGMSVETLAEKIDVPVDVLNDIVGEKAPITYEIAALCGTVLGMPTHVFMDQQAEYDRMMAKRNKSFMQKLSRLRKVAAAAVL